MLGIMYISDLFYIEKKTGFRVIHACTFFHRSIQVFDGLFSDNVLIQLSTYLISLGSRTVQTDPDNISAVLDDTPLLYYQQVKTK